MTFLKKNYKLAFYPRIFIIGPIVQIKMIRCLSRSSDSGTDPQRRYECQSMSICDVFEKPKPH